MDGLIWREQMSSWYEVEQAEIIEEFSTSLSTGLSQAEAGRRLAEYGPNELVEKGGKNPWRIVWEQLSGIMSVILIVSAVISLLLRDYEDAIAILAIVVLNTILGFTQEYKAEQAMAALKKMAVPRVKVRREARLQEISARELVPGDIVLLDAGSLVPADARLVESANLRIQEAVLTGESEPVEKTASALQGKNLSLGDQRNRAFMGTVITYGRGTALVTDTGMRTELGKIAVLLQGVEQEATPLQRRLEQLAKTLAGAALVVVLLVFGLGLLQGEDLRLMFMTAISMAVAAVPEGLPTVVTIGLALGAQRMLSRRALIRKLPAVETLGSVTVICSDKTGTLTENRMTVTVIDIAGHRLDLSESLRFFSPTLHPDGEAEPVLQSQPGTIPLLLACGSLCNDAILGPSPEDESSFVTVGDPTEGALIVAAARAGIWKDRLEKALPRVGEVPFESERKRMTTVHALPGQDLPDPFEAACRFLETQEGDRTYLLVTKGAVDSLLQVSGHVWTGEQVEAMDEGWERRIVQANEQLAQNGMRVLGVAFRLLEDYQPGSPLAGQASLEDQLIFLGMVGMIDPARPEVKEAVQTARAAGIRPIMITGDHPLTARYIARDLGIAQNDRALTGQDLAEMSVQDLAKAVEEVSVFARVSPEHKLKIVDALQSRGQIVAMTGDGVNDAPALKKAEIGVAMGITGTDVSKESADMVLLDDNFATIIAAVQEGRRIYDNIRKFIKYALGSNIGEILTMLAAPFLGMPLPLLPIQILWVNLVTDGLPGLALTVERAEKDTMSRPPYHPKENIFSRGLGRSVIFLGVMLGLITVGVGYWGWRTGVENWQTMAFTTLTLAQMGNVLSIRSGKESAFLSGVFSNRLLTGSVLLTVLLQLAVVYIPFLQPVFETHPLTGGQLAVCLGASLLMFLAAELEKRLIARPASPAVTRSVSENGKNPQGEFSE
jgi:Ca2+-transporting ATPase